MSTTSEASSIEISCDARALKGLRERVDISGRALARLMSVDPSAISRWSSGQRMPSYKQVMQLCRILGVPDWKIVSVHEENGTPVPFTAPEKRPTRPGKAPSGATIHPSASTTARQAASSSTPA
jgi:transcriptional regulator with XRE-family HTH domain